MNTIHRDDPGRAPHPADAARAAQADGAHTDGAHEGLVPLFPPELSVELRARWDAIQRGFVDDPARAVRQGDELVAQVIQGLAQSFSGQRARFDGEMDRGGSASTETLRVALQRYRSFFERLLSL